MPRYDDITIYTGVYFTTLIMAGQLLVMAYALYKKVDKPISPQSFFSYVTVLFCVLRIANLFTSNAGGNVPFFLNRLAILAFLTALSITLYTWMAALGIVLAADQGLVSGVRAILEKLQWIFLIGNIVLYVLQIGTVIAYMTTKQEIDQNPWYDASVLLFACVMFVMGALFVVQSLRLWTASAKCSASVQSVLLRASVCSMIVAVFFALRVALLLYRPITGKYLDNDGFVVGCYYLPELVPLALSLIVHAFRVTNAKLRWSWGANAKPRKSGVSRADAEAAGWTPRGTTSGHSKSAGGTNGFGPDSDLESPKVPNSSRAGAGSTSGGGISGQARGVAEAAVAADDSKATRGSAADDREPLIASRP